MAVAAPPRRSAAVGRPGQRLLLAMVVAVGMNLLAALLLDAASDVARLSLTTAALFSAAVTVNGARFLLWRTIHRRYRLADVMPLTALFFPLVALSSWLKGEPFSFQSAVGILLITAGVWTITRQVDVA